MTALGNVHEVCKKALLLPCGGQELQDDFQVQTFDELLVAVDDVQPTVSDGLYSKCTPPLPPPPSVCLLYYPPPPQKKRILNAPLPTCLSFSVSILCDQTNKRTVSETQPFSVTKPYFYRARELPWTDWVHGISSQLTDTKLQTKW